MNYWLAPPPCSIVDTDHNTEDDGGTTSSFPSSVAVATCCAVIDLQPSTHFKTVSELIEVILSFAAISKAEVMNMASVNSYWREVILYSRYPRDRIQPAMEKWRAVQQYRELKAEVEKAAELEDRYLLSNEKLTEALVERRNMSSGNTTRTADREVSSPSVSQQIECIPARRNLYHPELRLAATEPLWGFPLAKSTVGYFLWSTLLFLFSIGSAVVALVYSVPPLGNLTEGQFVTNMVGIMFSSFFVSLFIFGLACGVHLNDRGGGCRAVIILLFFTFLLVWALLWTALTPATAQLYHAVHDPELLVPCGSDSFNSSLSSSNLTPPVDGSSSSDDEDQRTNTCVALPLDKILLARVMYFADKKSKADLEWKASLLFFPSCLATLLGIVGLVAWYRRFFLQPTITVCGPRLRLSRMMKKGTHTTSLDTENPSIGIKEENVKWGYGRKILFWTELNTALFRTNES